MKKKKERKLEKEKKFEGRRNKRVVGRRKKYMKNSDNKNGRRYDAHSESRRE